MAKDKSQTRGRHWGITPNGEVKGAWESVDGDTAYITVHDPPVRYPVPPGSNARRELIGEFQWSEVKYVPEHYVGTKHEEEVIEKLKAKARKK